MTTTEAIEILKRHNEWRRGGDSEMDDPKLIGQAIDRAIEVMTRPELVWEKDGCERWKAETPVGFYRIQTDMSGRISLAYNYEPFERQADIPAAIAAARAHYHKIADERLVREPTPSTQEPTPTV